MNPNHQAALVAALKPFAEFARGWQQHIKRSTVTKTGPIYTIDNRAGAFSITVEDLMAARKVLVDQGWIKEVEEPKLKGRLYYVESGNWFIVRCQNAKVARKVGRQEFGENPRVVRLASAEEVIEYRHWNGLPPDDPIEFTEEPS